jgi:hypothetical protein
LTGNRIGNGLSALLPKLVRALGANVGGVEGSCLVRKAGSLSQVARGRTGDTDKRNPFTSKLSENNSRNEDAASEHYRAKRI